MMMMIIMTIQNNNNYSTSNDIACHSLAGANIQCVKEPIGVSRLDGDALL